MYSKPREKSINTVRSVMLKKMLGVDAQLSSKSEVDLVVFLQPDTTLVRIYGVWITV